MKEEGGETDEGMNPGDFFIWQHHLIKNKCNNGENIFLQNDIDALKTGSYGID